MNKLRDYLLVPSTNEQKEEPEEDNKVADLKTKLSKEKDTDALEKQIVVLQGQINLLKVSLENEKNKAVKPEPNPDTGEVPLRTGIAQALLDKSTPNPKTNKKVRTLFKKSLGKTKIEVNPDVDIGIYSNGKNAGNGLN
jgi:hypothetical protein